MFNKQTQQLELKSPVNLEEENPFRDFITPNKSLNVNKLFHRFLFCLYTVMEDYQVPEECILSRKNLRLVREFIPCEKCVDLNTLPPRFVRCEHQASGPTIATSKV
jgi:hypothetical protein